MFSREQLQAIIDKKTKPIGALGVLEKVALQVAYLQDTERPKIQQPSLIVFASDHGLAADGVSAYPTEVTRQMVLNFLNGGAAINVFCRQHGIDLSVVDCGVNCDFDPHPKLTQMKVRKGTRNSREEAAMTKEELDLCFEQAAKMVDQKAQAGSNCIAFGEMGIGNTAASSLLMSALLSLPIEECVGKGTGLDDYGLAHKVDILHAVTKRAGKLTDPLQILSEFGGYEIAHITGAILRAHQHGMLILVDGFIASAAYLVAQCINAKISENAIFTHCSDEKGHRLLLEHLNASPLLDLQLRLGEGTGCAIALPIIQSAVAFMREMASFDKAGVSEKT
ncbi:MAG: nicotinate-nucleotide--dimethylbenzimidazole phosphoribosyltransferase [Cyclobacteriaceae bacterium]|nr:nicotinate-nucleotide--dimethylbenzimidazole phosphoribosyltransferase [Cyclobacteriaceae bacterium]